MNIDTIQWNGKNLKRVLEFARQNPFVDGKNWASYKKSVEKDGLTLCSPEMSEKFHVPIGYWIIRSVSGKLSITYKNPRKE